MLLGVRLFSNEAEEPLLCLVISAVRYPEETVVMLQPSQLQSSSPVEGVLMLDFLSFRLLDGHTINGHRQLGLRGFAALSLLDLLAELQLPYSLLHDVDTLGLVYFCGTQELKDNKYYWNI